MIKVKSPQQFVQLNQREMIQRFLNPKAGLPVATNNLGIAALRFDGKLPAIGLPKVFVATKCNDYRGLSLSTYERIGIPMRGPLQFDVDHALARSLSFGRFDYVLMNPVSALPNRSFGSFEKQSKDRVFKNETIEMASIAEILKICEIAPARRGNLAEDLIVAIQTAEEGGIITKKERGLMFDTVRNSDNNVVSGAYTENEPDVERIISTIEQ
jgi:hypothetical protein